MTCFLSPHSDDIVLSCSFHIQYEVFERPYFLVTVFSQSTYIDRSFEIADGSSSNVTKIRLGEDSRYAAKYNMNFNYLIYKDALLRTGFVCYDPEYPLDQNLINSITKKLLNYVQSNKVENIIVQQPNGTKQHIYHRITYAAARQLCSELPAIKLYTVDDFPYSFLENEKSKISTGHRISELSISELLSDLKIYKSQYCQYFENQVRLLSKKINYELRYFKK